MTPYLRPTAPISADVLLPADPGLALALAQALLERPAMVNHAHGLWGYSGSTQDRRLLTIQASGIGAPSAAAVVSELAGHGARRVIRIGISTAAGPELAPSEVALVDAAIPADGASHALAAADRVVPDPQLAAALRKAAGSAMPAIVVAGTDLAYAPSEAAIADGADAVDLETAAVFALADRLGIAAGAGLVVGGGDDPASIERAALELGAIASRALA